MTRDGIQRNIVINHNTNYNTVKHAVIYYDILQPKNRQSVTLKQYKAIYILRTLTRMIVNYVDTIINCYASVVWCTKTH